MQQAERDNDQLGLILHYCQRLVVNRSHFQDDFATFQGSAPFQDSCALCLIQIGEAVHRLSDEFKGAHAQIDWHAIYGMRCHLVHGYDSFDAEIAWDAMENYIPPLRSFCEEHFLSED